MDLILSGVCSAVGSLFVLCWACFHTSGSSLCGQATAQCWYETETAGGVVFAGSVLLPTSQALHPGRHGGPGKPRVQQQEDRTYPNSPPVVQLRPADIYITQLDPRCSHEWFTLKPEFQIHIDSRVCVDCLIWITSQGFKAAFFMRT